MTAQSPRLILGKEVSAEIYSEIIERVERLSRMGIVPHLTVIMVGDDPASDVYVRNKERKCKELGIRFSKEVMSADTTEEALLKRIDEINNDDDVHALLVQLPLPPQIDEATICAAVSPRKDVDCFNPCNAGKMVLGNPVYLPATPAGIQQMLLRSGVETTGKHVVVVGRSAIVGRPMAAIMMQKGIGADATVTVVHSRTNGLSEYTKDADILIVAMGKPRFITGDMVKDGAVVIDVGTNRIDDPDSPGGGRLVGDVDFDSVAPRTSAITPVPGGVGPMTICMLMDNTVKAAELAASKVKQ